MNRAMEPSLLPEKPSRLQYRRALLRWTLGLLSAGLFYPLLRFSRFRLKPKPRYVTVPAPLPLSGVHAERDFILVRLDDVATAVARRCTHLGCRVNYHADKQMLICPCHQSQFSPQGVRLAGPAERDLTNYPVEERKDDQGRVIAYVVQL